MSDDDKLTDPVMKVQSTGVHERVSVLEAAVHDLQDLAEVAMESGGVLFDGKLDRRDPPAALALLDAVSGILAKVAVIAGVGYALVQGLL